MIKWIDINKQKPKFMESCLCVRKNKNICNLYLDVQWWMDDGYDSKQSRIFNDVTHWIYISDINKPIIK